MGPANEIGQAVDMLTCVEKDALLAAAVQAARAAGAIARRHLAAGLTVGSKGVAGPVTAADLEADACLRSLLLGACPDCGWLSEETPDSPDRLDRQCVWVVDPLDGTREYMEGLDEYAVAVALVAGGEPVLAVVYNPARDELFTAVRGRGSFRNGDRVACTRDDTLGRCTVLASPRTIRRGELASLDAEVGRLKPVGSLAYRLALVAAGLAGAAVTVRPKSEWDVCAGDLLVREAGGCTRDLAGRTPRYNQPKPVFRAGLVAGAPQLVQPLIERLRAHRP